MLFRSRVAVMLRPEAFPEDYSYQIRVIRDMPVSYTHLDFSRLYEMVEPLYCEDNGRPSVDPVVLFKMVLLSLIHI